MKTKLFAANFIPILAQASSGDLAGGASKALGIVMLIGFIFGTICVVGGGFAIRRGDTDAGKLSIIGGLIIAALIYIAVAFTAAMLVDTRTLTTSSGPLLEVVKVAGLAFPPKLFAMIALLAVSNTALMNMIMASRLVYGMAGERVVPPVFAVVHPSRNTPWVAILFTVAIAVVLVATGDVGNLAETTVLLLLCAFALVNVSVLMLRRRPVDHDHYRAPTWMPVLGALACLILILPITGRDPAVYARAGVLIAIGMALWFINRVFVQRMEETGLPAMTPEE